jgi:cell division protein FtsQ
MSITKNIRRIIFICIGVGAGGVFVVLLAAAVNARNHQVCKGYEIEFKNSDQKFFIDKKDVEKALTANKTIVLKNKPVKSIDLNIIEARLKKEPWVKDAEIFFDNNEMLKVKIMQREPVARLFSSSGGSFYIDTAGVRMPLSDKASARLPVFTGYPIEHKKNRTPADIKLVREIKTLSQYLVSDPFWMAQIAQVHITPAREFEMIPTIGNHVIEFGDGTDHEAKFRRLFIFYKQVLAKTGMDTYERIKVQYDNEVIGVKKSSTIQKIYNN